MTEQPPLETKTAMTGIAIDALAQAYVKDLEDRECRSSKVSLLFARRAVSRRTGVGAGTLANLRRGRIKGVRAWILDALRAALIKEIEADIARERHQLAILEAAHRGARCQQVEELRAGIETKRRVLNGG